MDELAETWTIGVLVTDRARAARVRSAAEERGCVVVELASAERDDALDVIVVDAVHPRVPLAELVASIGEDRSTTMIAIAADEAEATEAVVTGAWDAVPDVRERIDGALARALERQSLRRRLRAYEARTDDGVVPLRELERRAIEKALAATRGSVEKAARMLGMGRATLYRRLATMGTTRPS